MSNILRPTIIKIGIIKNGVPIGWEFSNQKDTKPYTVLMLQKFVAKKNKLLNTIK